MQIPRGPVTDFLVVSNVLIWASLWLTGYDAQALSHLGFIPALVGQAFAAGDMLATVETVLLRPLASAFLHGGFMHVALNMMILLLTGRFVEGVLGGRSMVLLYVVSAYAAALADYVVNPADAVISIGSSGAGAGIIAAYMLLYAKGPAKPMGPIPAYWARRLQLLALWAFINLALFFVTGSTGGIGIFAHMGGFAAGLVLTQPLLNRRIGQRRG